MIISFSIQNYKSFKDKETLLLSSTGLSELRETNILPASGLLKSLAIYGKNAAGKSKLIEAMQFMKEFVIGSSKESQSNEAIDVDAFRLNTATKDGNSSFEIGFSWRTFGIVTALKSLRKG